MVQLQQATTLLVFLATAVVGTWSSTDHVATPHHCQGGCSKGEVCTEEQVVCKKAPCNPVFTCVPEGNSIKFKQAYASDFTTTSTDSNAYMVVTSEKCQPQCQPGQACTEHLIECEKAPCDPEYVCASSATANQTNPCYPEVCPQGSSCVPATSPDGSPIAVCVPSCWVENCDPNNDNNETCVMKPGPEGSKEATCVSLESNCHPVPTMTCANVRCPGSPCKMIDCDTQCTLLVPI